MGKQLQKQLDILGAVYGNEALLCEFLFKRFRRFRVEHEDLEGDLGSGLPQLL
jgi:hypothetical protein